MKYMLLIYLDPAREMSAEDSRAETEAYIAYSTELGEAGKFVAGDPLQGTDVATTVTVRDGRTITTDGPFAETKEILGGYYIVDVENLDEALAWAAKIPTAAHGSVEVRPLAAFPGM